MAYHKIKKKSRNQVKNMMTGEIPALISNKLQKFCTQFNEGQKKLANFAESSKTLKELVEACNKKITGLEKTVKAFGKKE